MLAIYPEMAKFDLADVVAVLRRTPLTLDALLRGLPDVWVHSNEGENTWSAFDIMGHLISLEGADWMVRVRFVLENGADQPFAPVDRASHLGRSHGKPLEQLLDEFARLREENIAALEALQLPPDDLARRGRHPTLGTVTLSELLAAWAVHDLTHLHQLARVMAHQYRDATGPWSAYLGVLACNGHSAS